MANFGTRLAYPSPARRPTDSQRLRAVATAPRDGLLRRALRRTLAALVRAVDEAPFDLAWPPTPRAWPALRTYGVLEKRR